MSFKLNYAFIARNRLIAILLLLIVAMIGLAPSFFKLKSLLFLNLNTTDVSPLGVKKIKKLLPKAVVQPSLEKGLE